MKIDKSKLLEAIDDEVVVSSTPSAEEVAASVEAQTGEEISKEDAAAIAQDIKAEVPTEVVNTVVPVVQTDVYEIQSEIIEALDANLRATLKARGAARRTGSRNFSTAPFNMAIYGLPGGGKTSIVEDWARNRNINVCALKMTEQGTHDFFQGVVVPRTYTNKDNDTDVDLKVIHDKSIVDSLSTPYTVLILDEFNRERDDQLRQSAMELLATKKLLSGDGRIYDFRNTLLFTVIMCNPGDKIDKVANLAQPEKTRFTSTRHMDPDTISAQNYFFLQLSRQLGALGVDVSGLQSKVGLRKVPNELIIKRPAGTDKDASKVYAVQSQDYGDYDVEFDLAGSVYDIAVEAIKKAALGIHIVTDPSFSFDGKDNGKYDDAVHEGKPALNNRLLTQAIEAKEGDARQLLAWVNQDSDLIDADKDMLKRILRGYKFDLDAFCAKYDLDLSNLDGAPNTAKKKPAPADANNTKPATSTDSAPTKVGDTDKDIATNPMGTKLNIKVKSPDEVASILRSLNF